MEKILITMIQVINPSEAGMRQHRIVVIKFFATNLYHHSHFLAAPFDFNFFHTGHFKQGRTFFLQPGCFE